jgi:hypothetical protein
MDAIEQEAFGQILDSNVSRSLANRGKEKAGAVVVLVLFLCLPPPFSSFGFVL